MFGKTITLTEPPAADAIPAYIADGIDRQATETLAAIEEYARARREHLEALEAWGLDAGDLADVDEELVDVEDGAGGTVVIKKVPCGKDRGGCPHGPYKYVVQRVGDNLNWEYKAPAEGD